MVEAENGRMSVREGQRPGKALRWILVVSALSLPSVAFVLLHQLVVVLYYQNSTPLVSSPVVLDRVLLWPVLLTGELGGFFTAAALVVTLAGSFRRDIPGRVRGLMWGLVTLSLLACLYIALAPFNLASLVK